MRKSDRIRVGAPTRMRPNDWSSIEVELIDISAGGFKAACEARVLRGSIVTIDLPGLGPVEAQVTWHRAGRIGAKFLTPIDLTATPWRPAQGESLLLNLLRQRASARKEGRFADERELRQRILSALPIRTVA
ncbi:MAG: PilZ domain-containing protein [Allosphingosinicella sp.]|uniref:PilZ domain-containing protein n=1 Tax=Allosphingosinicella sp. TaxID=2823234 RepID=UPI00395BCCC6